MRPPIMAILLIFLIGISNEAHATIPDVSSFQLNNLDSSDPIISNGDTITISFTIETDRGGFPLNVPIGIVNVNNLFDFSDTIGDNFDGQWINNRLFVINIIDSNNSDIQFGLSSFDPGVIPIRDADNPPDVWNTISPFLQLLRTGGGEGCDRSCQPPTLGVVGDRRLVENGFSFNGNPVNVEQFFTPYPLIKTETGKNNIARLKIYDESGPENIQHVELAFGLKKGNTINQRTASILWDKYFDGTEVVNVYSPTNAIDNVRVHSQEGFCDSNHKTKCLILSIQHRFRTPLDFEIVGTNVWNMQRSSWQNYFNHGIDVDGKSLNPAPTHYGIDNGKLTQITESENNTAYDEEGNKWIFDKVWKKTEKIKEKIDDGITSHWFDRNNARFNTYKMGQELLAQQTFNELTGGSIQNDFLEEPKTFHSEFVKRSDNPELQKLILHERHDAEKLFKKLFHVQQNY